MSAEGARLNLLVLYSDDVEACREFYEGMGLDFAREKHEAGPEHYSARLADGCVLELYPARGRGPSQPLRIGLTVARGSVRDRRLLAAGSLLRDPDGRAVALAVA